MSVKSSLFFVLVAFLVTCGSLPAQGQEPVCPEGYKCIPEEVAARWKVILEERQCQDEALDSLENGVATDDLSVTYEPYAVIVSKDGQVFDRDELVAHLKWCSLSVKLKSKPQLQINMKKEDPKPTPVWGFRLRVRLGVNVWPKALFDDSIPLVEPVLGLEPFFVHDFHVMTWAGFQTFGVGAGVDVTRNANVYLGVGGRWANADVGPVVGVSLSFN